MINRGRWTVIIVISVIIIIRFLIRAIQCDLTHIIPVVSWIMNAFSTCFHVCADHHRVGMQWTTGTTQEHDEMLFGVSRFALVIKSCYNVIMITKNSFMMNLRRQWQRLKTERSEKWTRNVINWIQFNQEGMNIAYQHIASNTWTRMRNQSSGFIVFICIHAIRLSLSWFSARHPCLLSLAMPDPMREHPTVHQSCKHAYNESITYAAMIMNPLTHYI